MATTARKRISGRAPRRKQSIEYLTPDQSRQLLDELAREELGMSGEEFVRRYEAGEIEDPDRTEVLMLSMLIPFAR